MRVLITGGAGYIGRHTVAAAAAAGHTVATLDRIKASRCDATHYPCDIAEADGPLEHFQPDVVVHLAASIAVGESVENPEVYFDNNIIGSLKLLKAMRASGVRRIIFASSAAVYGHGSEWHLRERVLLDPLNPYGETKRFVERALEAYRAYGLESVALRYFNASGGAFRENHSPETHLIPLAVDAALHGSPLKIHGTADLAPTDGSPTAVRDYVSVRDIARANVAALRYLEERPAGTGPEIFNIGSGRGHSVLEVVREVELATGKCIACIDAPWRPGDPRRLVADVARAERYLGWLPSADSHLQAIVADTIATRQ